MSNFQKNGLSSLQRLAIAVGTAFVLGAAFLGVVEKPAMASPANTVDDENTATAESAVRRRDWRRGREHAQRERSRHPGRTRLNRVRNRQARQAVQRNFQAVSRMASVRAESEAVVVAAEVKSSAVALESFSGFNPSCFAQCLSVLQVCLINIDEDTCYLTYGACLSGCLTQ